jgi:prophage regulatory protein
MAETLLLLPEVKRRTGKSTSAIYEQMAAGTFPRPIKRGRQSVWVESEVQAVIDREIATLPRMGPSMGARRPEMKKPLKQGASR